MATLIEIPRRQIYLETFLCRRKKCRPTSQAAVGKDAGSFQFNDAPLPRRCSNNFASRDEKIPLPLLSVVAPLGTRIIALFLVELDRLRPSKCCCDGGTRDDPSR